MNKNLLDVLVGLALASITVGAGIISFDSVELSNRIATGVYIWHLATVALITQWVVFARCYDTHNTARKVAVVCLLLFQFAAAFCDQPMINFTIYTTSVSLQCIYYLPKVAWRISE